MTTTWLRFIRAVHEVYHFIQRVKQDEDWGPRVRQVPRRPLGSKPSPERTHQAISAGAGEQAFRGAAEIEAIATYEGEVTCTNADLIRNHAYCWSRMSAVEISEKTGIESRCYTEIPLEEMALLAAKKALSKSERKPAEIGAVLFCSCTSSKLIPFGGHLALRRTGPDADAQFQRHRCRLRRHVLWHCRSYAPAAGDRTPGAAGVCGKILRQDWHGAHFAHDLRRWRCGHGHRSRAARDAFRYRGLPDLRQRALVGGELDHLAKSRIR